MTNLTGANDDSSDTLPKFSVGAVAYNGSYALAGFNSSEGEVRGPYLESDNVAGYADLCLLTDRSDGFAKFYSRHFRYDLTNGRVLEIGDTVSRTNHYSTVKYSGFESLLAS